MEIENMAGNYARPQQQRASSARPSATPVQAATGAKAADSSAAGAKRESDYKLCLEIDGQMAVKEGTENVWQWFGNGYVNKDGSIGIKVSGDGGLPAGITKMLLVKPKTKA
jgi:hypothetical protein